MSAARPNKSRELVKGLLPEIRQHLNECPGTSKLIPLDNWAAMLGLTKGSFYYTLKNEDPVFFRQYVDGLAGYYARLRELVMSAKTTSASDLSNIMVAYDVSFDTLQAIARRNGRHAPSRKTITGEKVAAVAKVGMTVKDLAAAAGLHAGSLKSAKNLGRLDGFVEFEQVLKAYPGGSANRVAVVSWVKEIKLGRRKNKS